MPESKGAVYLADLVEPARTAREENSGLHSFLYHAVAEGLLHWPRDVVDQWPYTHAGDVAFLTDYGHIDLASLIWSVGTISCAELLTMPTGASEHDLVEYFAKDPEHWVNVRNAGCHVGVRQMWDVHGTWKRWPVLIDRSIVSPAQTGLQLVEGRTRVGVLRGRVRLGLHVAPSHLAWVGRAGL